MYTAICFYMSEGFRVKAKITQHSGTFVYAIIKVDFFYKRVENNRLSLQLYEYDIYSFCFRPLCSLSQLR